MSNTELDPQESLCVSGDQRPTETGDGRDDVQVLTPRAVPLGGIRAMTVRRTLPQRARSLIGPWCFLDHYGPDDVAVTGGMVVPPHPHIGLQTVSWLFQGTIEHRDSVGSEVRIHPGDLGIMTAGHGIAHSEVSVDTTVLHGVQLWVALPDADREVAPAFDHYRDRPVAELPVRAVPSTGTVPSTPSMGAAPLEGMVTPPTARVQVIVGELAGVHAPARSYSPVVAAEIHVPAGAELTLPLDPGFEHGLLVDAGEVVVDGVPLPEHALGYLAPRRRTTIATTTPARLLLIGGAPLGERIVMWWNFVGREHDDIVRARDQWQDDPLTRFGEVTDYPGERLPAPPMPTVRLRPRSQPD